MTPTLSLALPWLVCPTCQRRGHERPLNLNGRSLRCEEGHCLDIAKQGHVTMMTSPAGANADTPAMVTSRQRVLDAGLFHDLDGRLTEILADRGSIVEVGAGTGHHLAQVLEGHATAYGLATDVSSAAIRKAARTHPRMAAVVADTWAGLPIRTGCMDAVLCVFAPRNRDEFKRILRPDGLLVVVTPLPEHLHQLRETTGMIGIQPHKHDELVAGLESQFEAAGHEDISTVVGLDGPTASDVVAMGPSAHHVQDVHVDAVEVTSAVEITTLVPR